MLNGLVPLLWWRHGKIEPKIYDVLCPECGWRKTVELNKTEAASVCRHDSDAIMETKTTLPNRCPICGKKLKKRRLKIYLRY